MNNREKFLSVMSSQPYAKMPIVHFGYWDETVEKWKQEGHVKADESQNAISQRFGFDFEYGVCFTASTNLLPAFETKVIEEFPDGSMHVRNGEGVIELKKPGATGIPMEIGHTLVDRASWEKEYKWRLEFKEERYDFSRLADYVKQDAPLGLHGGSLYGLIRNWFGVVGLSYLSVDDEEFFDEVIHTVGDLCYKTVELGLEKGKERGVTFDYIHFWEDICFNHGPLISPPVFEEKCGPYYKKITDLGKAYGVDIFSLDCDGRIDQLIPIWLHNGVDTMFPIEVGTWHASIAPWRELYGKKIRGVGGMDKKVLAYDYAAIDREIERLKPLMELGGFIPCPDHRIPPDAKFENVQYYCEQLRKVVEK